LPKLLKPVHRVDAKLPKFNAASRLRLTLTGGSTSITTNDQPDAGGQHGCVFRASPRHWDDH
jgi:hypothetical protein